ncbi:DUF4240 domain-containing protein [Streptomyces sp. NRRL B-24484]|uniref:DUF4240 domain-containing protein n=1 Tax=Streptomyces sp. NRRL B-24484 TaxID=1463833 RepID=UPI0004C2936C|nr:DUF4240 domain-containing protein [Streptomyces sp. NRRL B-24484]
MDEDTFWQLLDVCRPGGPDPDAHGLAALRARLAHRSLTEVVGFAERLSEVLYRLDRREYGLRLPGDAFLYTRAAVVAAGRAEYEAVLRDPRRFAPYSDGHLWAEPLLYVPDRVYRALTGREWDRSTRYSYESSSHRAGWEDRPPAAPGR